MTSPFACDMTAIPAGERPAHQALSPRLMTEAGADGVKAFIKAELYLQGI